MDKASTDRIGHGGGIATGGPDRSRCGDFQLRRHRDDQHDIGMRERPDRAREFATVTPTNDGGSPAAVSPVSSSLPFTGADVEELAVVGAGAILAGGLLLRRRRMSN